MKGEVSYAWLKVTGSLRDWMLGEADARRSESIASVKLRVDDAGDDGDGRGPHTPPDQLPGDEQGKQITQMMESTVRYPSPLGALRMRNAPKLGESLDPPWLPPILPAPPPLTNARP